MPKINVLELFCKSIHQIFLKLFLIKGIEKLVKVTVFDFYGKFLVCSKEENGPFLDPKSNVLDFSPNLFIRVF